MISNLLVSAPGRICLFGEHQDYLHLPVITAAINLRISIKGKKRNDNKFVFRLPDIGEEDVVELNFPIAYQKERDYLRSPFNVLHRMGICFPCGYDVEITSEIPINSGTSSSSAMIVAFVKFLLTIAEDRRQNNAYEIARLAHLAEVVEFGEPGGMMDHFATAMGDVLFIDFRDNVTVERLNHGLGTFVLGDSMEPKNTKEILQRVKGGVLEMLNFLQIDIGDDLWYLHFSEVKSKLQKFSDEQIQLFEGMLKNRDITDEAHQLFSDEFMTDEKLGELLIESHKILKNQLKISTDKMDEMIRAGLRAGALGGKLNGSGGGGCMFVYAPHEPEKVAEEIEKAGGKAYIIEVDEGVKTEFMAED